MIRLTETKDTFDIASLLPAGMRGVFLLLSLFPLLAPYELILRPRWHDYWNLPFLFAAAVSLGAITVSALLVWAAIAGLDSRTRFDRPSGLLTHSAGAPVVRVRTSRYPIASLERLEVGIHEWSDGPPSYAIRMILDGGRSFDAGSSWSREEIDDAIRRVSAFLGIPG